MNAMSLRQQVLLAVIVPVTVLCIGLSSYFAYERYHDIETHHRQLGVFSCVHLALDAGHAIDTGDLRALKSLAASALAQNSVSAVTFYDAREHILLHAAAQSVSNAASAATLAASEDGHWLFESPVLLAPPDGGARNREDATNRVVGRVEVAVSSLEAAFNIRRMLLAALLAAAGGIATGVAFAFRIGEVIGQPLRALTNHVKGLERGIDEGRAVEAGAQEAAILARGINQLSDRVNEQLRRQEARVDEATSQLQRRNQDLESTRNGLQKALKAKDEFLATISHELRTPLTSIIGYNRLLATTVDREQALAYIRHIELASTLLRSLINDVLDYSRLQSQALSLEQVSFDLESCLEDVVGMHGHEAIAKQLELVLLIDSDVPRHVVGDPQRLQQVINNLLSNAIKFTVEGEVVVQLGLDGISEDCATLRCQIRDSGPGIPAEDRERLFDPFVQGDSSINRRYGGSGLGLAICRSLLAKMGGSIALAGNVPHGTTAEFTFQLRCPAAGGLPAAASLPANTARVLAYDGHDWSRRALRNLLSRWTRNVSIGGELDKLLTAVRARQDIDLLVISLTAAEAERAALLGLLRDIRQSYQGPLLLISAIPDLPRQLKKAAIDGPPAGFALRPLSRQTLLIKCDDLLAHAQDVPRQAATASTPPLQGLTILVAEDNGLIRALIHRILVDAGAAVDTAQEGMEAVQACQRDHYDLVLLDVQMPGMDGITAARRIRRIDATLPIVCLTAAISPLERQLLSWAHVDTILIKPVDDAELVNVLASRCGRAGRSAPAPALAPPSWDALRHEQFRKEIARLLEESRLAQRAGDGQAFEAHMHELMGLTGMLEEKALYALVRALKQDGFRLTPNESDHLFGEARALLDKDSRQP